MQGRSRQLCMLPCTQEGRCEWAISHVQVLLGIAAGAWLLTPDWIAASAAAGKWLSERSFQAEVGPST